MTRRQISFETSEKFDHTLLKSVTIHKVMIFIANTERTPKLAFVAVFTADNYSTVTDRLQH
jgi:hypothetical protein